MNAAELRALAEPLTRIVPADLEAAADVLELIAWAEEGEVHVKRDGDMWFAYMDGVGFGGDTLIETLWVAREAAR